MNDSVVTKICTIHLLNLPLDMTREIVSYLYHDKVSLKIHQNRSAVSAFLKEHIIRYEEYVPRKQMCIWGVGFLLFNCPQMQQQNCLRCGNFVYHFETHEEIENTTNEFPCSHYCSCFFHIKKVE